MRYKQSRLDIDIAHLMLSLTAATFLLSNVSLFSDGVKEQIRDKPLDERPYVVSEINLHHLLAALTCLIIVFASFPLDYYRLHSC